MITIIVEIGTVVWQGLEIDIRYSTNKRTNIILYHIIIDYKIAIVLCKYIYNAAIRFHVLLLFII